MKSALSMIALAVALAATCGRVGTAHAEDASPGAGLKLGSKTVPLAVLEHQRGGTDAHLSELKAVELKAMGSLDGSVSEVKAFDLLTGSNSVSDGAFSGASGVPMVIQNSGNGVLIQNATILNVMVQ